LIKTEYDSIVGMVVLKNGERVYEGYTVAAVRDGL
jgi:hypothetical protein